MHLAKGLEYKAIAVMACDDDVLPLQDRVEAVADESELDEVYETERHLFYVACRATSFSSRASTQPQHSSRIWFNTGLICLKP
jgi:superfamily I DNA/RNA helicase